MTRSYRHPVTSDGMHDRDTADPACRVAAAPARWLSTVRRASGTLHRPGDPCRAPGARRHPDRRRRRGDRLPPYAAWLGGAGPARIQLNGPAGSTATGSATTCTNSSDVPWHAHARSDRPATATSSWPAPSCSTGTNPVAPIRPEQCPGYSRMRSTASSTTNPVAVARPPGVPSAVSGKRLEELGAVVLHADDF